MNMAPIMKGVAIAALYKVFIGVIYYMVIASWSVFYLAAGFTTELPWYTCLETWNTRDCYSEDYNNDCQQDTTVFWNFTCSSKDAYCENHGFDDGWRKETDACISGEASTPFSTVLGQYSVSSAEDYFNGRMLGLTKDQDGNQHTWEDFGSPQWELVLCQLFCYILTTLTIIKSAKSLGKAAYVFTVLPYIILTILLIYGLTLPGSSDGIDYYLDTDWSYLSDSRVWTEACVQIIMSLGVGVGIHMVLASYNDNDSRILLDATFIGGLNSATSIYAGFVVFAMTGFLAYSTHSPVESVSALCKDASYGFVPYKTSIQTVVNHIPEP